MTLRKLKQEHPTLSRPHNLRRCVSSLKEYGEVNPSVHGHRYWLALAEQRRWAGDHVAAEAAYEKAIDGAEAGKFLQVTRLHLRSKKVAGAGQLGIRVTRHFEHLISRSKAGSRFKVGLKRRRRIRFQIVRNSQRG